MQDLLEHAQELKQRGNAEFGQGRWEFALETYREGLRELPVRRRTASVKGKEKALPSQVGTDGEDGASYAKAGEVDEEAELEELSELRAILSANIAACLLKLVRPTVPLDDPFHERELTHWRLQERWKEAVSACDDGAPAQLGQPVSLTGAQRSPGTFAPQLSRTRPTTPRQYIAELSPTKRSGAGAACPPRSKVRSHALPCPRLGSLALTLYLADFNKLSTLSGNSSLLDKQIKLAQARLPKKIEVQQAKEKDEVVGKLKDLGNMVLGASVLAFPLATRSGCRL